MAMHYRRLGQVGVKVSELCIGAGVRDSLDESRFVRSLERAIELGYNFIDYANNDMRDAQIRSIPPLQYHRRGHPTLAPTHHPTA